MIDTDKCGKKNVSLFAANYPTVLFFFLNKASDVNMLRSIAHTYLAGVCWIQKFKNDFRPDSGYSQALPASIVSHLWPSFKWLLIFATELQNFTAQRVCVCHSMYGACWSRSNVCPSDKRCILPLNHVLYVLAKIVRSNGLGNTRWVILTNPNSWIIGCCTENKTVGRNSGKPRPPAKYMYLMWHPDNCIVPLVNIRTTHRSSATQKPKGTWFHIERPMKVKCNGADWLPI